MIRKSTAVAARQNFGDLFNQVQYRNDSVLITKDGKPVPFVLAQWAANAPAAMAAQYLAALKSMKSIAIDTGDTDFVQFEAVGMHDELTRLGVAHDYDLYVGDHGNKVPERFRAKVLPFFTKAFAGVKP